MAFRSDSFLGRIGLARKEPAKAPRLTLAQALEAAMHDEKRAPEFFLALLEGSLWTLVEKSKPAQFADAEGKPFIPVFSDREFLPRGLPAEFVPVQMPGKEVFAQARGVAPIVLNPGQPRFKLFGLVDIEAILDRLVTPSQAALAGAQPAELEPSVPSLLKLSNFTDEDWKLIGRGPDSGKGPFGKNPTA